VVRLLRVWFAILVLLGSAVGFASLGPAAVLRGLVEETRSEGGVGSTDPAEDSAAQWALLSSKRNELRTYNQCPPTASKRPAHGAEPAADSIAKTAVPHRPLPRILFRRSLPSAEEPPLTNV
jgi:hypothetical protein